MEGQDLLVCSTGGADLQTEVEEATIKTFLEYINLDNGYLRRKYGFLINNTTEIVDRDHSVNCYFSTCMLLSTGRRCV